MAQKNNKSARLFQLKKSAKLSKQRQHNKYGMNLKCTVLHTLSLTQIWNTCCPGHKSYLALRVYFRDYESKETPEKIKTCLQKNEKIRLRSLGISIFKLKRRNLIWNAKLFSNTARLAICIISLFVSIHRSLERRHECQICERYPIALTDRLTPYIEKVDNWI